jgi:hypothetical protein
VEMDGARVAAVANGQTVDLKRVGSTRPGKWWYYSVKY